MYDMDDFKKPIIKNDTRIFRPYEWQKVLYGCPKIELRTMLEALLYTGMRYIEMKRLQEHPEWFDGDFVHLSELAQKKVKRKQKERWVRLNSQGKMVVRYFLNGQKKIPSYQTWNENVRTWARRGGLQNLEGICCKCTRKTWESWLLFYYPTRIFDITTSQGHTQTISIQHYVNMPFTERDQLEIKGFVEGWVPDTNHSQR